MPERPKPSDDPYRTLGLQPGASAAEIKRAYRHLAKEFHPDSAGEAALPRFLSIHEAYEQLRTGRLTGGPRASRAPTPPPAEAWRADPERARAARERARAGRGAAGAGGRGTAGPGGGTRSRSGGGAGATGTTGSPGGGGRGRRSTRKATLGSTSYDEARDPNDPAWSGAAWYGPSSGEYWIINPREYADPRKHGPEYQQRARRLAGEASEASESVASAAPGAGPSADGFAGAEAFAGARAAAAASSSTAGAAWTMDDRRASEADRGAGSNRGRRPAPARGPRPDRPRPAFEPSSSPRARAATRWDASAAPGEAGARSGIMGALGPTPRELVGGPADDPIRRLGIALVAWPPLGLAAAALIGDLTGCATYSAACGGTEPLLPWLAQAGILGLLLLLPPIARLLAGGSIAVLVALLPISMLLLALGGSGERQAPFAMWFLLGVAWLVGIGWSAMELRRRRIGGSPGAGPTPGQRPGPMRGAS